MSRIGKKPIDIPEGVTIEIGDDALRVKGKNAELSVPIIPGVLIEQKEEELVFSAKRKDKQSLSNWGTMRSLVANAVQGVSEDFVKKLVIEGVGYRANMEGNDLVLGLGYSHPIKFKTPEGIKISVEKNNISISGASKELVGEVAAKIRSFRKPEPYKGKGVRYSDEVVKRKVGKKAVGGN